MNNPNSTHSHFLNAGLQSLFERKIKTSIDNLSRQYYREKRILITGAAGSIGSHICKKLTQLEFGHLILFDHNESGLFNLQQELQMVNKSCETHIIIGDICNQYLLEGLFKKFSPDIVFHAAAYKHVPLMEQQPLEAVRTNIMGSRLLAQFSVEYKSEKFVFVSTDKALNPAGILGATKRIAELYIQGLASGNRHHCDFIACRFGNVLESNGSVVPLFRKQIENGGPVTITDPNTFRFLMTIDEAVEFLLESGARGKNGDLLFYDMGKAVRILDLARTLNAQLSSGELKIKYIGLRPGEKLHEEDMMKIPGIQPTWNTKIFSCPVSLGSLTERENQFIALEEYFSQNDEIGTVKALKALVPEFKTSNISSNLSQ